MNQVGTHLLANVTHVPDTQRHLLTHLQSGKPYLDTLVNQLQLHVVAEAGHQFPPIGYTYAYVLSESHFTIHTYPEYQSCYIDIFCCSSSFHPAEAIRAIQQLFHTEHVEYQVIMR